MKMDKQNPVKEGPPKIMFLPLKRTQSQMHEEVCVDVLVHTAKYLVCLWQKNFGCFSYPGNQKFRFLKRGVP